MGKKFLLYIHRSEEFEREPEKSGLVNRLLEAHYDRKDAVEQSENEQKQDDYRVDYDDF